MNTLHNKIMIAIKIKQLFQNQFVRNFGWMGGAELANRVLRLATVVVLARLLSGHEYGLTAIVLTIDEIAGVFLLEVGMSAKLIQADSKDVDSLCESTYWMCWILSCGMSFIQCLISFPVSWFYAEKDLILPICIMALYYLQIPFFSVQLALIHRENRLKIPAFCNLVHGIIGNSLTILLAFLHMGIWAIILPKLVSGPIWVYMTRKNHPWRPAQKFTLHRWSEITSFALDILGVDLLNKVRSNIDYLLIGRFLGIDALGLYYFAFNAGLGMSLNLINAITASLYPHLCSVRENIVNLRVTYNKDVKAIAVVIIPLVCLQAGLASTYVPVIYGSKWTPAIPILILICLSALPRPFAEAASMLLQASGKTRINLYWNIIFTIILLIVLFCVVKLGVVPVALAVFLTHFLLLPLFSVWANQYVFKDKFVSHFK